jgi:hypothetical protein
MSQCTKNLTIFVCLLLILRSTFGADNLVGGRINSWGDPYGHAGVADYPLGRFLRVSCGSNGGAAQRPDGTLVCWGSSWDRPLVAPSGVFLDFVVTGGGLGIRADETLVVWGEAINHGGLANVPSGLFKRVAAGGSHFAALRKDGVICCWGYNAYGQCNAPAELFVDVSAAMNVTVGLRLDGTVARWGENYGGWSTSSPEKKLVRLGPSSWASGRVTAWDIEGNWYVWDVDGRSCQPCMGYDAREYQPPATMRLSQIVLAARGAIGLTPDGLLVPWGNSPTTSIPDLTDRHFQSLDASDRFACGIRFPCPADFDFSDQVDSADLGNLLLDIGQCDSCDADFDQNGEVDSADLGALLLDFGSCP